jgi:NTE family protein
MANVLDGLLVDQVADDVQRLAAINSFLADGAIAGSSRAARAYRASRGRAPYRRVSYAIVAPERPGEIAAIAERVFARRYGGLRGLRAPDFPLLSWVLGGGRRRSRGELLSFLLFDEVFVEELIQAGRRDAERWLERHPRIWCADAAHDFDVDAAHVATLREEETLVEFRELRRH